MMGAATDLEQAERRWLDAEAVDHVRERARGLVADADAHEILVLLRLELASEYLEALAVVRAATRVDAVERALDARRRRVRDLHHASCRVEHDNVHAIEREALQEPRAQLLRLL